MSGIYLLQFFLGIAIAFFQQTAPTNPYRAVENWAKRRAGREWGQVSGVELDAHGNLWVIHRTDPPILEFDPSGNLLKSFGSGMFVQPHSLHFDRDGNLWATDGGSMDGKGDQLFKFNPEGKVLLTLGRAGIAGDGTD